MSLSQTEFNAFHPKLKKNLPAKNKKDGQIRRRLEDRLEQIRIEREYSLLD